MAPPARRVVVVGGSAGGLEALTALVRQLPDDLPAAVLAVLHFPATSVTRLASILSRAGPLPAHTAEDGEPLLEGHIYVSPADRHLLAGHGRARVSHAPRENGHRPAIDPLFRSAARSYGPAATGVVLCGMLDDGAAGLFTLRKAGGIGVVLDPESCDFADMPRNAIELATPEHVVPLEDMGRLVGKVVRRPVLAPPPETPAAPSADEEISLVGEEVKDMGDSEQTPWGDDRSGTPSGFSCPECHGVLWEVDQEGLPRFECRIGHRVSAETLLEMHVDEVEAAMWAAVRALGEQASLARTLEDRAGRRGDRLTAERFKRRAEEAEQQAGVLRRVAARPRTAGESVRG